jgi:hypothetical protein
MAAIFNGLFGVIARKNAGGGTSPGTGNLLAWYDFNDATDSVGSYNLTEVGTPTYTGGYGVASDAGPDYWSQSSLDNVWGNADQNWSFVARIRPRTGIVSGKALFVNASRSLLEFSTTTGWQGAISKIYSGSPGAATLDVWYTVVVTFDTTGDICEITINNSVSSNNTGAINFSLGTAFIGSDNVGSGSDVDVDYVGFFSDKLTADEITFFGDGSTTTVYADL